MHYNLTNLAILFFCYSFLGWGIETSVASVKHKCYRNRGFLSGPMAFPELYSAHFYTSFDLPLSFCFWDLRSFPPLSNG